MHDHKVRVLAQETMRWHCRTSLFYSIQEQFWVAQLCPLVAGKKTFKWSPLSHLSVENTLMYMRGWVMENIKNAMHKKTLRTRQKQNAPKNTRWKITKLCSAGKKQKQKKPRKQSCKIHRLAALTVRKRSLNVCRVRRLSEGEETRCVCVCLKQGSIHLSPVVLWSVALGSLGDAQVLRIKYSFHRNSWALNNSQRSAPKVRLALCYPRHVPVWTIWIAGRSRTDGRRRKKRRRVAIHCVVARQMAGF